MTATTGMNSAAEKPHIERVIFNKPVTVVFWSDGTKTRARCNECPKYRSTVDNSYSCATWKDGECWFQPRIGLAIACARKMVPGFTEVMNEWAGDGDE